MKINSVKEVCAICGLIGLLLSHNLGATVLYKKVDKDGKVTFTDKPIEGAEAITVDSNKNVIKGPQPTSSPEPEEPTETAAPVYTIFAIDTPHDNQSISHPQGALPVVIGMSPPIERNHSIRLHLDGQQIGRDQKVPYFNLANISRSSHELVAMVLDDDTGQIVQTSQAISFVMSRPNR